MSEYIQNFFGCGECRHNFRKMAATIETDVNSNEEGVLWLWQKHNKVNMRLHGDLTEDPRYPKMQFPSHEGCDECHLGNPPSEFTNSEWQEEAVLKFLLEFYGNQNVIQDSAPYHFQANTDFFASANLQSPCSHLVGLLLAILFFHRICFML